MSEKTPKVVMPPGLRFWFQIFAFQMANRERRPYQRLLAQNRFEIACAKELGLFTRKMALMERFLKLVTFLELPRLVRFWIALGIVAHMKKKVRLEKRLRHD